MKCQLCKFINAALEAERHPNGTTIYAANALRKLRSETVCTKEHDRHRAEKALQNAMKGGYTPLDQIWYEPVHVPSADRHGLTYDTGRHPR